MTYELAKELKDAGFPQKERGDCVHNSNTEWGTSCDCFSTGDYAYVPTLSELIEACGSNDAFVLFRREIDGVWTASGSEGKTNDSDKEGSTPEEAVARLWLALNKKI